MKSEERIWEHTWNPLPQRLSAFINIIDIALILDSEVLALTRVFFHYLGQRAQGRTPPPCSSKNYHHRQLEEPASGSFILFQDLPLPTPPININSSFKCIIH